MRPTRRDEKYHRPVAEKLYEELVNAGYCKYVEDREEAITEIEQATRWQDDGYQIANSLDGTWSPDAVMVEILDGAHDIRYQLHAADLLAWVEETKPEPKLKIGDQVMHKGKPGEIVDIVHKTAEYIVNCGDHSQTYGPSGYVVPFEKVKS